MKVKTLLLFFITYFLSNCNAQQHSMKYQDSAIEKFKAEIGFNTISKTKSSCGVVSNWQIMRKIDELESANWKLAYHSIKHSDGGAEGFWGFQKSKQNILVRIFASNDGTSHLDRFLGIASSTSMPKIPYKSTDKPIGTLSIKSSDVKNFIWIYCNMCFLVKGHDTETDIESLAREIQEIAEKGFVDDLSQYTQFIEDISTTPSNINVNDIFQIRVILSNSNNIDDYMIEFLYNDDDIIDITEEEDNYAFFRALKKGNAEVQVKVINKINLLSSIHKVPLNINP